MGRPRFFVANLPDAGGTANLDADAAAHARVLRLRHGAEVTLFDGSGREHEGAIENLESDGLEKDSNSLRVRVGAAVAHSAPTFPVVLVQCMPKGSKLDGIVRMATELGVAAIQLAISERSTPSMHGGKLERLRRIAREASRQSGRAATPEVHAPLPLSKVPDIAPGVVFWESAVTQALPRTESAEAASDSQQRPHRRISVVVGPEGGLSHQEVHALTSQGVHALRLPGPILRVETAAVVALTLAVHRRLLEPT